MPVEVVFEDVTPEITLPKFRPASMILDLHLHSERSDDSRAPVEAYLKLLRASATSARSTASCSPSTASSTWRATTATLEDAYGFRILNAAEVETDYGHVLVYGVNADILARFDFTDVRLPAQEVITRGRAPRRRRAALPSRAGRTSASARTTRRKPPLEGVIVAVEALNGGSRKGEDERVQELIARHGYAAFGGSDSHLVSFVGICATEFEARHPDHRRPGARAARPAATAVDFRPQRSVP